MGLYEKALRDRRAELPNSGFGLFDRALARREQSGVAGAVPATAFPPPEAVSEAFPFSAEDIHELALELRRQSAGVDELLAAFARISEALPLDCLALLIPEEQGTRIAASLGFRLVARACSDCLLEELARAACEDPENPSTRRLLGSLLYAPEGLRIRGFVVRDSEGLPKALWVYADTRLDASSTAVCAAFDELFAADGRSPAAPPTRQEILDAERAATKLARASGHAAVFLFELGDFIDRLDRRVPGLERAAVEACLRTAAERVLKNAGAAFCLSEERLAACFYATTPLDAELALAQFRKSLKKLLPFLSIAELPAGKAIGLDLAYEGAKALLARFLA